MPRRLTLGALVLVLAVLLPMTAASAAPHNWIAVQLTFYACDHGAPAVSGDRVAWIAPVAGHDQVFTWKAGDTSPTMLTSDAHDHDSVVVSGDDVVWRGFDGTTWRIFFWKAGSGAPVQVPSQPTDSTSPDVSGDRVVWLGSADWTDAENPWRYNQVYTWAMGESVATTLTDDIGGHLAPKISEGRIVWADNEAGDNMLFTYRVSDGSRTLMFGPHGNSLAVSGDNVVFLGNNQHDGWQVYGWQPVGGTSQLSSAPTDYGYWPSQPDVSGTRAVWIESDGAYHQVFTRAWGETTPTMLTTDTVEHDALKLSGDRVVWQSSDGANLQIWTLRVGGPPARALTSDATDHRAPDISGDRVVWLGMTSGHWQVFTATEHAPHPEQGVGRRPAR